MVQPESVTDQQVMGLNTVHLRDLVLAYPELDYGYLGKQGQDDCRCGTFVAWELLGVSQEGQADLSLDDA